MRCMATGRGFAASGAVGYCAVGENYWNVHSRTCARPAGCGGSIFESTRTFSSGYSCVSPAVALGCCCDRLINVGTPRSHPGRAAAVVCALFRCWDDPWGYLRRSSTFSKPTPAKTASSPPHMSLPPLHMNLEPSTMGGCGRSNVATSRLSNNSGKRTSAISCRTSRKSLRGGPNACQHAASTTRRLCVSPHSPPSCIIRATTSSRIAAKTSNRPSPTATNARAQITVVTAFLAPTLFPSRIA